VTRETSTALTQRARDELDGQISDAVEAIDEAGYDPATVDLDDIIDDDDHSVGDLVRGVYGLEHNVTMEKNNDEPGVYVLTTPRGRVWVAWQYVRTHPDMVEYVTLDLREMDPLH